MKNQKFRSNRLEFQPSFVVKLLFITVLQSHGACFREQSKFFKSGNLFFIYLDELPIHKLAEPWNIKGHFPESWGLRASVSSSPLPSPFHLGLKDLRPTKTWYRNPTKPAGLIWITTYDSSERLNFFDLWNLPRIWDCQPFSVLKTLTGSRAEKSFKCHKTRFRLLSPA